MAKYRCEVCGYIYDEAVGDPAHGTGPGTKFEDLPHEWVCPLCGAQKANFREVGAEDFRMMPIAPLMIEHRLIERMAKLAALELGRLKDGGGIDLGFNRTAVDFFRVYADKLHHGKEEQILFRELGGKNLLPEHRSMMEQLSAEHVQAREKVGALEKAQTEAEAMASLEALATLYPSHIANEDRDFFIPVMNYFDQAEKDKMLQEGETLDRSIERGKYKDIISNLEEQFSVSEEK